MTSDIGVERVVGPQFFFHCSCGAAIETTERMVTCGDCGETVEVRRCIPTPTGKEYTLRISKHRCRWSPGPPVWTAPCITGAHTAGQRQKESDGNQQFRSDPTRPTPHHGRAPDCEKGYLRLGSLILLLAGFSIIAYSVPAETYQNWAALAAAPPKPDDCSWTAFPLGDKGCHYEPVFHHVNELGEDVTVTWQRVND